jgi:hypothetical protein
MYLYRESVCLTMYNFTSLKMTENDTNDYIRDIFQSSQNKLTSESIRLLCLKIYNGHNSFTLYKCQGNEIYHKIALKFHTSFPETCRKDSH